jgi:hypothetical protein
MLRVSRRIAFRQQVSLAVRLAANEWSSRQLFQSQLPDARNQRAGIDSEQLGGTARAVNSPAAFVQRSQNAGRRES